MIEFSHIPNQPQYHKVFYASGDIWQVWQKPNNVNFIYFYVIGAGGAGGGGRTGAVNSGGGGGGGGSSSVSVGLFPAFMLPDILYVQVGLGVSGATAGAGAASGDLSYVSVQPNTNALHVVMKSGDSPAGGGGGGTNTGTGAGVGGTAGAAWTYTNFPYGKVGMITSVAGQTGGAGGSNVPADAPNITPILGVTAGTGGGSNNAGGTTQGLPGNITGSGFLPTISGGTSNVADNVARAGKFGFMGIKPGTESYMNLPMVFTGGSGGGAGGNTGYSGGTGGNGSYGSGGGGGGASYSSTGGSGGRGGDGLVLISCW